MIFLTQTFFFPLLIITVFSIIASFSKVKSGRKFGHLASAKGGALTKKKNSSIRVMISEHHGCF